MTTPTRTLILGLCLAATAALHAQNLWQNSGNIGIGTTNPDEKVVITGNGAALKINAAGNPTAYYTKIVTNWDWSCPTQLFSNGTEILRTIYASPMMLSLMPNGGSVGVGTSNPLRTLHIMGGAAFDMANTGLVVQDSTDQIELVGFKQTGSTYSDVHIRANSTGLVIKKNTGNVGIGTLIPISKFHVVVGTNQSIATFLPQSASGITDFVLGGVGLQFSRPENGAFAHAIYTYDSPGLKNNLAISSRSDIVFTAGNGGPDSAPERMRIADTGNVGIGTADPSEKLSVNGKIRAREVIVETAGWSDNVFTKGYHLTSLSELEQDIQQQGHLPGVPSAQEVAEKGVSVGDMHCQDRGTHPAPNPTRESN